MRIFIFMMVVCLLTACKTPIVLNPNSPIIDKYRARVEYCRTCKITLPYGRYLGPPYRWTRFGWVLNYYVKPHQPAIFKNHIGREVIH